MKEIQLTQGKVAHISDHRFEHYNQWKWFAHKDKNGKWYAERQKGWPQKTIKMHREIMGVTDPKIQVDHRDSDGLNNVDENLRICTNAENAHNRGKPRDNRSGYKGVSYRKDLKKYVARIGRIHLGFFSDPIEAARAYDAAAIKHHGEFARTNF